MCILHCIVCIYISNILDLLRNHFYTIVYRIMWKLIVKITKKQNLPIWKLWKFISSQSSNMHAIHVTTHLILFAWILHCKIDNWFFQCYVFIKDYPDFGIRFHSHIVVHFSLKPMYTIRKSRRKPINGLHYKHRYRFLKNLFPKNFIQFNIFMWKHRKSRNYVFCNNITVFSLLFS